MEYGFIPETQKENELELCRMGELAKQWGMSKSVYKGKTNDLNLHLAWFCPHCHVRLQIGRVVVRNGSAIHESYKSSKMERVYEALYCSSHYGVCEYEFVNKDLRRAAPAWWSSGFQFPLNPMQLHQARIEAANKAIESNTKAIERHKANIEEQQKKLIELEKQTIEVQASMLC